MEDIQLAYACIKNGRAFGSAVVFGFSFYLILAHTPSNAEMRAVQGARGFPDGSLQVVNDLGKTQVQR